MKPAQKPRENNAPATVAADRPLTLRDDAGEMRLRELKTLMANVCQMVKPVQEAASCRVIIAFPSNEERQFILNDCGARLGKKVDRKAILSMLDAIASRGHIPEKSCECISHRL